MSEKPRIEEMQAYSGNDLGRFVTTYNSEYSCQRKDFGDRILCTLSVELTTKNKPIKNEIVQGKTLVKEGKRRGEKAQEGWKVRKGARERNPEGVFAKRRSDRIAASRENKSTQTQNLTDKNWSPADIWNKSKLRPSQENLSKVQTALCIHVDYSHPPTTILKEQKEMRGLVERLACVKELTWKNRLNR